MRCRSLVSVLAAVSLFSGLVACNSAPKPQPRRPGLTPQPDGRPDPRRPTPPAPRGPDVSKTLALTVAVDGLARLDKQVLALLPPLFAKMARGQALRRMLPNVARKLGLNGLVLDALDHHRAAAIGLLLRMHRSKGPRMRWLAALPIKGDGKLVVDGLRASYPSVTRTAWGGLRVGRGSETYAWVRIHRGWVVAAPTAPLLDSAYRYLVPQAKALPAGHVRARINAAQITRTLKPAVAKAWRDIGANIFLGLGMNLTRWMKHHKADLEALASLLGSTDELRLELAAGAKRWRWHLDVVPRAGGPLARWLARQKPGQGFGLKVLPKGPFVALSGRLGPDLRSLVSRLAISFTAVQLKRASGLLPREVALRGLLKRKRPASIFQYRRALRDLNLTDYRASHRVYRVVWHAHQFQRHLKKTVPPLLKTTTGKLAGGLYVTGGPGLGLGAVVEITNRRRHERQHRRALWGTLQNLNRFARAAWQLLDKPTQKALGTRPFLQFIYRQNALRVGRVTASAVALRVRWPKKPYGKLPLLRRIVETVLGPGDLTWAWAYVGKRKLVSAGRDWRPRLRAMIRAATGKGGTALAGDPHFAKALKAPPPGRLGLLLFSGAHLMAAVMRGLFKLAPKATRSMELRMLGKWLQNDAKNTKSGTYAEVVRRGAGVRIQSVLPPADVRSLMMSVGYLLFASGSSRSAVSQPSMKVPHVPPPPSHPRGGP